MPTDMPTDTILVIVAVLAVFSIFASTLIWGQLQGSAPSDTRPDPIHQDNARPRPGPIRAHSERPPVPLQRRRAF